MIVAVPQTSPLAPHAKQPSSIQVKTVATVGHRGKTSSKQSQLKNGGDDEEYYVESLPYFSKVAESVPTQSKSLNQAPLSDFSRSNSDNSISSAATSSQADSFSDVNEDEGDSTTSVPSSDVVTAHIGDVQRTQVEEEPVNKLQVPSVSDPDAITVVANTSRNVTEKENKSVVVDMEAISRSLIDMEKEHQRETDEILARPPLAVLKAPTAFDNSDQFDEKNEKRVSATSSPPKKPSKESNYLTWKKSISLYLDRHFLLTCSNPEIVLPKVPNDQDKYCYLKTHRSVMCALGAFAFLCNSAGLWLFTLASPFFYWFGPIAGILQLHIMLFHLMGFFSKDFDFKYHSQVLQDKKIGDDCPTIDVYLPVCKEPLQVLANTWDHVSKLEYPINKLKIWVLDDGALDEVKELSEGYGFNYIRRDDRPYFKKSGNLRYAFARTEGEYFAIFDADFCPRSDFLLELVPRMMDDANIAIIQTPQFFKTVAENTWIERGASQVQELFYRWCQTNRDHWGASICVGSNALYRREALKETGGTALVDASEDVHTGFYAITRGWKLKYIPICLAAGMSPDTPRACFSQQTRWSQGSTSLLLNGDFIKAKLGWKRKLCFLSGMLYYWNSSISMFTIPLPGTLLLWFRPDFLRYYNLAFIVPSLLFGAIVFRLWSASTHSLGVQHMKVLQGYAYLYGIINRITGKAHVWVSSGDSKAHKSNVYSKARALAIIWTGVYQGAFFAGVIYRVGFDPTNAVRWFQVFPQLLLMAFHLYISLPFLLSP